MENALEIRNLCKNYGDFSLKDVNITLPRGCIMGFIGENGAGKSTTIKLVLGLIHSDGGSVTVMGRQNVAGDRELKERIGVVMDESSFPDNLTLRDIGSIMARCYKTWDCARFAQYADKFALPEKKPVKDYSRGMKMKLSIAVALSHASELLILDEATSGLDPIVRDEILDVFLEFIQDESHSIFISSHIISDLEKICDYITFIHQGRIVFSEEKDALLEEYSLVKCTPEEYARLDPAAIIGARKSSFGVEALVKGENALGLTADHASIEDIMLYHVKEAK